MARKTSRRSHSRKMKHTKKHGKSSRVSRRRTHRRRGGMAVRGAPLGYSLSGDWSSKMSLGQGNDFESYHKGQHGGEAAVELTGQELIDAGMRGPAMQNGPFAAYAAIAGLKDQNGGKRRRHRKSKSSKKSKSKSRKSRRGGSKKRRSSRKTRHRRRRGGALGYSPVSASSMLLSGPGAYAKAGLNPGWNSDVAFNAAKQREGM